jgi:type III secretion protein F
MNLDAIVGQMSNRVARMEGNLQSMANLDANNPTDLLRMQYALQQYSMMVSYQSTVMKTIKDMVSGILAKM